jgi:cobyrinic acid a,c-diamide synthase
LHARNAPIYAECGGFMILTQSLIDSRGDCWPMAGLLPGNAQMTGMLAALGYRHATALRANLLAETGASLRGHEFRHSHWICETASDADTAAWHVRGTGNAAQQESVGYARGNLLASYLHIHFGQCTDLAPRFVRRLQAAAPARQ